MAVSPTNLRQTDDFAPIVGALSVADRATQGTKVNHPAVFPQKRVQGGDASAGVWSKASVRLSDNEILSLIIATSTRDGVGTAERPDVLEVAVVPEKSASLMSGRK